MVHQNWTVACLSGFASAMPSQTRDDDRPCLIPHLSQQFNVGHGFLRTGTNRSLGLELTQFMYTAHSLAVQEAVPHAEEYGRLRVAWTDNLP